jgi:hypothetical protein
MASATGQMLFKTSAELDMDTTSKGKECPNKYFQTEHINGLTTINHEYDSHPDKKNRHYINCDNKYRATGAKHTLVANAASSAIFVLGCKGAAEAAQTSWKAKPETTQLAHIQSSSDISWALWLRAMRNITDEDVKNIKCLFNTVIIDKETNQLIKRAIQTLNPPLEDPTGCSGLDLPMDKALLRSPMGRWAGCFLMQHMRQLGGDKYIEKIRVFKSERAGCWLSLVFYAAGPDGTTTAGDGESGGAVAGMKARKSANKRGVDRIGGLSDLRAKL